VGVAARLSGAVVTVPSVAVDSSDSVARRAWQEIMKLPIL
jgi:hypothetical protein